MENDKQATSKTQPVNANSKPCVYCKGEQHSLTVCRKLKSKPHKEKIDFLRSKGLCFACLKHGHMSSSCKEKVHCQDCSRLHPTLLHMNTKDSQVEAAKDRCEKQYQVPLCKRWKLLVSLGPIRKTVFFQSFQYVSRHKREPRQWQCMPSWTQVAQPLLLQSH